MTETNDITQGAMIDENTPVGRVYRFYDASGAEQRWQYTGFDPLAEPRMLLFLDHLHFGQPQPPDHWNTVIAPTVSDVRFAESEQVSPEPESPQPDIPNDTPAKHLARIHDARETVLFHEQIVADLKAHLKDAKEHYAEAVAGMMAVIGDDPNQLKLFEEQAEGLANYMNGKVDPDTGEVTNATKRSG